jgi:hypothetical protein
MPTVRAATLRNTSSPRKRWSAQISYNQVSAIVLLSAVGTMVEQNVDVTLDVGLGINAVEQPEQFAIERNRRAGQFAVRYPLLCQDALDTCEYARSPIENPA